MEPLATSWIVILLGSAFLLGILFGVLMGKKQVVIRKNLEVEGKVIYVEAKAGTVAEAKEVMDYLYQVSSEAATRGKALMDSK